MSRPRIRDLSVEEFSRVFPRIAGGAPTLEELLKDLDSDLRAIKEPTAPAEPATPPAAPEPTEAQKALDARDQALKDFEARLTAQADQLTAQVAQLKQHGGSRLVQPGADPAVIEHVAAGGSLVKGTGLTIADPRTVTAGDNKGVDYLRKSHSFGKFFAAMAGMRDGSATDTEREWMMGQKALAEGTGSAGGFLIPPDWMSEILPLFRGVTCIRRANPRIVPFTAQMNQVQMSTGATAYYTAENAAITPSQETFSQVTILTPHNLTGLIPVSSYLLTDSRRTDVPNQITSDAEQAIRQDLAVVMALKEDKNFLMGLPGSEPGSPTGIVNIAGIQQNPIAPATNGFQPTLPQLRQIRNYVRRWNVPNPRWAWFFHSQFLSYVEQLTDSLGRFLADTTLLKINDTTDPSASGSIVGSGAGFSGVLDSIPFFCSNQIPNSLSYGTANNASWLLLVDMNQLVVGLNQDMVVDVSTEASYTPDGGTTWVSAFQNNQTLFKAVLRHDINHLYPYTCIQQNGVLVN